MKTTYQTKSNMEDGTSRSKGSKQAVCWQGKETRWEETELTQLPSNVTPGQVPSGSFLFHKEHYSSSQLRPQ